MTDQHAHGARPGFGRTLSDEQRGPIRRGTIRRVSGLYSPYRWQLTIVVALVLATAGLGVITPLLIRHIIDVSLPSRDQAELIWLVAGMIAVAAVSGGFNLLQAYLNVGVGFSVMRDLRRAVYRHLQRQPLAFFTRTRTGDIQSRLSSDVASTQLVLTDTLGNVVSNLATVAASIIAMLIISWQLSLVAFAVVPIFVFFTVRVARRRRRLTGETQRTLAELTARTGETLSVSGILLAKTFGRDRQLTEQFEENNNRLTDVSIRQQLTGRAFFVIVQTFFTMAPAIIWLLGGLIILGESAAASVTIGDIVAFTTIQVRLLFPLSGLLNRGVDVTSSLALFDRIFEYLDLESPIADPPSPVPVDPERARGEVRFENVRFGYPPGERPLGVDGREAEPEPFALTGIDFTAEAGRLTALVGPSGSGKTTVGYLLARLYDVDEGRVLIDGVDVRDMRLVDLSRLIGVVSQEPFLFHASIKENLLYGKPDASDNELVEAAMAAQIHLAIDALPDGYDTIVGERGYRLSGGERQRVAIARVVLGNPRILLLDEATSSLDTLSERLIQQALSQLRQGRTTIAIAHRLSTIMAADQILVMEAGQLHDKGSHEELIRRSDLYRRLYEEQFAPIPAL